MGCKTLDVVKAATECGKALGRKADKMLVNMGRGGSKNAMLKYSNFLQHMYGLVEKDLLGFVTINKDEKGVGTIYPVIDMSLFMLWIGGGEKPSEGGGVPPTGAMAKWKEIVIRRLADWCGEELGNGE